MLIQSIFSTNHQLILIYIYFLNNLYVFLYISRRKAKVMYKFFVKNALVALREKMLRLNKKYIYTNSFYLYIIYF